MSTRAIIALPVRDGYETAWCWNDGGPSNLGAELRRYFKTKEDVRFLINEHSFSNILGPRTIGDYVRGNARGIYLPNGRWILQYPYQGKVVEGTGEMGFFKGIPEMLECDLDYVYVFRNGKWTTYK